MTRLTLTSDSMRAREMEERRSLRVLVSMEDVEFSLRRDSRSFPPSSANTMMQCCC